MTTTNFDTLEMALADVRQERKRQELLKAEGRFKYTCADPEMEEGAKLACLMEELGEVGRNVLARKELVSDGETADPAQRKEVMQVAALAVAWMEALYDVPATFNRCKVYDSPEALMDAADEAHAHEVMDEKLRWDHGTLSTRTMERILADVLTDLWYDCYRRDAPVTTQYRMFCEKVVSGLYAATGTQFTVK